MLSLLLALRDVLNERQLLFKPRHNLPSPELYATGEQVHARDLYSDDPYDAPLSAKLGSYSLTNTPKAAPPSNHARRRSSAHVPHLSVTLELDPKDPANQNGMTTGREFRGTPKVHFPESSKLSSFQWPPTPPDEKGAWIAPEVAKALSGPEGWTRRRRMGVLAMLREDVFGGDWWKMAIPAVLFALQNNLIYVASRNLSVPVFQITFQLKTLITALTAVVMLGRRLSATQWASLFVLGGGVATMQLGAIHAKAKPSASLPLDSSNYFTGIAAVLVSCLSSAIAATYFELVIKKPRPAHDPDAPEPKPASLWVRNIQLSLFSCIFGIAVVFAQANPTHVHGVANLSLDLKHLMEPHHWYDPLVATAEGFFDGFRPMTWVVIFLQTVGGLLIAVAIKHADNISKGFALAVSIVFTFILSIIFFDFRPTKPSIFGALAVIASTLLFEADGPAAVRFMAKNGRRMSFYRPSLAHGRRQRTAGLLFAFGCGLWLMLPASLDPISAAPAGPVDRPTIALADLTAINTLLAQAASNEPGMCHWGLHPHRESTHSAFGDYDPRKDDPAFPYFVTDKTSQYALEDVLATRLLDYENRAALLGNPTPDFIFLPILSQVISNPWDCGEELLMQGIDQTVEYIREIVRSVGHSTYPRVVLPVTTLRSNLEEVLFTPELMEEIKDQVIVVSIENAPKAHKEKMKYLIDLPYPTAFHLSATLAGQKTSIGDAFFDAPRPNLLHYAASASHPWGLPASETFNGFALRAALFEQFDRFTRERPAHARSSIIFDNIVEAADGHQNLTMFHEHMTQARFCPMPAGDSPSRRGFFEAVQLGCIPVVFRERSYGRLFPSSPEVNELSRYTVYVDETEVIKGFDLISHLEQIPEDEVRRLQRGLREVAPKLQYALPDHEEEFFPWTPLTTETKKSPLPSRWLIGKKHSPEESAARRAREGVNEDAFGMLLHELAVIKRGEWKAGVAEDHRREGNKVAVEFGSKKGLMRR